MMEWLMDRVCRGTTPACPPQNRSIRKLKLKLFIAHSIIWHTNVKPSTTFRSRHSIFSLMSNDRTYIETTILKYIKIDLPSFSFWVFFTVFLHSSSSRVKRCIAFSLIAKSTRMPRIVANKWASSLLLLLVCDESEADLDFFIGPVFLANADCLKSVCVQVEHMIGVVNSRSAASYVWVESATEAACCNRLCSCCSIRHVIFSFSRALICWRLQKFDFSMKMFQERIERHYNATFVGTLSNYFGYIIITLTIDV